ncbi:MAG: hypothetical protein EON59_03535 [Alphaproteobacteria bacterium]|nr:MAG: hypothetical protein EON59_03535 [Alphaproteobacteria bacterium]
MLSLYRVFQKWSVDRQGLNVLGRQLQPELAEGIFQGSIHPEAMVRLPLSHWREDLADLEHKWTTRKESAKRYGESFVDAQDIIRSNLSKVEGK